METLCNSRAVCVSAILTFMAILPFASAQPSQACGVNSAIEPLKIDLPIIGELEMITDGDKRAQDGSFVEPGPFVQHVTIDLEEACEIYAILVWHWQMQARVYFDVVVQIADDADRDSVTKMFTSEKVKAVIERRGIKLVSYADAFAQNPTRREK